MACVCSIDACDDFCQAIKEKTVVARKKHVCGECGHEIKPGETYEIFSGVWGGDFFTAKTCALCVEIRNCFFCSWNYEAIWDVIIDEKFELNLNGLDSISKEARDKFFEIVDLEELEKV
jgi:hypothetical protein